MKPGKAIPWGIMAGMAVGLLLTAWGFFVLQQAKKSRADLPELGVIPEFQFTERSGAPFGQMNLLGKISVVDFFFTRCEGICPVMASKFSQLYRVFEGNPNVQLISISVDPEYDTPAVLRHYAEKQGVSDDRWIFLNGSIGEVYQLCEKGFLLPADQLPMGHSAKFTLLDAQGRIRGYYDSSGEMTTLIEHIRPLLKAESL